MIDVSIIIVSWNAKGHLMKCLRSIESGLQRHRGEIIVVDNRSSDGSPQIVRKLHPDVRLIENPENMGFAKANNIGIRQAKGRYICLMNSDVIVLPDCIDRLIRFMDRRAGCGIAGPEVHNTDGTLQPSHWGFPSVRRAAARTLALDTARSHFARLRAPRPGPEIGPDPGALGVDVLSGCFMLIRRSALEQVGLLDEGFFIYGEDVDLCRRFRAAGWTAYYYSGARAIHAGGASSANAPLRFFLELQKANLRYWSKHHGQPGRCFFVCNAVCHHALRLLLNMAVYPFRPSRKTAVWPKIQRSRACLDWLFHGAGSARADTRVEG